MRQAKSFEGLMGHGGRVDVAAALHPAAPTPWIDLSTGINPLPWQAGSHLEVDLGPLPTTSSLKALEATAASYFDVDPDWTLAVPGSEIGLRLLPFLGLPPVQSVGIGYVTHREIASELLPIEAIDRGTSGTILLANPNSPDGRLLSPDRVLTLMEAQCRLGGWLVLDEAFADVARGISIASMLDERSPAIVFRSFGKFFGLAGLRLGFVIAPPAICTRFRSMLGDWPVTAQAIAIGTAAYSDRPWIARTRSELAGRADRLDRLLGRHGFAANGACSLFRLVDHPDALSLFDRLAHAGILTRVFDCNPRWLRFGLPGSDEAFDRLERALGLG